MWLRGYLSPGSSGLPSSSISRTAALGAWESMLIRRLPLSAASLYTAISEYSIFLLPILSLKSSRITSAPGTRSSRQRPVFFTWTRTICPLVPEPRRLLPPSSFRRTTATKRLGLSMNSALHIFPYFMIVFYHRGENILRLGAIVLKSFLRCVAGARLPQRSARLIRKANRTGAIK